MTESAERGMTTSAERIVTDTPKRVLDATEIAIVARALRSAADEMNASLIRSAFSTVVREAQDCSTALLDADGNVIAQAETIPMQTAALSLSFRAASAQLDLKGVTERHAIIMNDPYSGGQHLNDIILFSPIIFDGALIGWSGSTAHHLDIGGGSAGIFTQATDLIQEGLVIPPILMDIAGAGWRGRRAACLPPTFPARWARRHHAQVRRETNTRRRSRLRSSRPAWRHSVAPRT